MVRVRYISMAQDAVERHRCLWNNVLDKRSLMRIPSAWRATFWELLALCSVVKKALHVSSVP